MKTAIWWVRRDLRLQDNQALEAALQAAEQVIPLFILDPALLGSRYAAPRRTAFLLDGLRELDAALRGRGGRLVLRQGDAPAELQRLQAESGAEAIYAQPDVSPYALQRDRRAADCLPLHWVGSPCARPPGTVLTQAGQPYTVFTPFSRAWKALPGGLSAGEFTAAAPAASARPLATPANLDSLPLPEPGAAVGAHKLFPAGEGEALRRLRVFSRPDGRIAAYAAGRDRLDWEATSTLSPYLRFGMLAPQAAVQAAAAAIARAPDPGARRGAETWLNELIWREFYLHLLTHFPRARQENFRLLQVDWRHDPDGLAAWQAGETGYPVVDAAMRQLCASGWMHNRARMISASFLTKDLLIDWRLGEEYFMQQLLDGDPAANNGGWQWSAGTGADAAPYFRIFNPRLQSQKFDPQGGYIRRWLPELEGVPLAYLHAPWEMPLSTQAACGCRIGRNYPAPIVDHALARQRTLAAYHRTV